MTFSDETLSLLVLISLGLAGLALLFSATGSGKRGRDAQGRDRLSGELRGVLVRQARAIQRLEQVVATLYETDRQQKDLIEGAVRRVGLIRYDAFEDVGGRLSFSCALLDERGNGVVVTSINGRQDTRVYAKPITAGKSAYNLSVEEEEAIRQALARPREVVKAR